MSVQKRFKERYKTGARPWDAGKPDFNLMDIVKERPIQACKSLEIGCGTGDNAIWLAGQGFDVTAFDVSEIAIQKATDRASIAGAKCAFYVIDFLKQEIPGSPFGFVLDRGCFHAFESIDERKIFVDNVASHLLKNGLWLSLIGNSDELRHGPGPPQLTAVDIASVVESYFEILSLKSSHFGSDNPNPPRAWVCLMLKREKSLQG